MCDKIHTKTDAAGATQPSGECNSNVGVLNPPSLPYLKMKLTGIGLNCASGATAATDVVVRFKVESEYGTSSGDIVKAISECMASIPSQSFYSDSEATALFNPTYPVRSILFSFSLSLSLHAYTHPTKQLNTDEHIDILGKRIIECGNDFESNVQGHWWDLSGLEDRH